MLNAWFILKVSLHFAFSFQHSALRDQALNISAFVHFPSFRELRLARRILHSAFSIRHFGIKHSTFQPSFTSLHSENFDGQGAFCIQLSAFGLTISPHKTYKTPHHGRALPGRRWDRLHGRAFCCEWPWPFRW